MMLDISYQDMTGRRILEVDAPAAGRIDLHQQVAPTAPDVADLDRHAAGNLARDRHVHG